MGEKKRYLHKCYYKLFSNDSLYSAGYEHFFFFSRVNVIGSWILIVAMAFAEMLDPGVI